jgi:hypothetical protein
MASSTLPVPTLAKVGSRPLELLSGAPKNVWVALSADETKSS